jgi:uncharacterized RDD family membrane protein YckC
MQSLCFGWISGRNSGGAQPMGGQAASTEVTMACPTCGADTPDWALQCPSCGAPLSPAVAPAGSSEPPSALGGWSAPPPSEPGGWSAPPPPSTPPPSAGWGAPQPASPSGSWGAPQVEGGWNPPDGGQGSYPPPGGYPPPGQQPPPYPGGSGSFGGPGYGGAPMGSRIGQYSGWWYRVGATIIDALILGVVNSILQLALKDFGLLLALLVGLAYNGYFLSSRGQTVGMMALGTRVADANTGANISFWRGVGRYAFEELLLVLLFVPWLVDVLFPLWDGRKQTLHDKVVNTVIVHSR